MAKSDVLSVPTVTIGGVTIKRWWRSKEIWNYALGAFVSINGLLAVLAPVALPYIGTLGLSPRATLFWLLLLNLIIYVSGFVLKFRSTAIIGGKSDVAEANAASDLAAK